MKKHLLVAVASICLSLTTFAQAQRTILYEEFTGENCAPCAATNPGLTTFIHQPGYFPTKILLIRYQSPIPSAPGVGSLYQDNPSEVNTRLTYYSVPFAPYARFDGFEIPEPASQGTGDNGHAYWIEDSVDYPNIVPDSAIVNAPFSLTVNHAYTTNYDSVSITAVVTAAQNYTSVSAGSLVLQVAMEEAAIHFASAPGSNGEKDFYDVMRKMVPSMNGTVLNTSWTTAATQTITLKEKVPTYIHDKNQLAFVAFVQDNGTKRVHQAAYSVPQALSTDAGIPTTMVAPVTNSCNDTINLSMTLKNYGTNTLTACTVNYKLDNVTVHTQPWSGSLAVGQTTSVSFPQFITSIGSHTLLCYSSNPNSSADQQTTNDTAKVYFSNALSASLPIVEGFETASSLPNTNWNIMHTATSGNNFMITSAAAATGSNSIMMDNLSNTAGNNSIIQTAAAYDMTVFSTPTLTFKAAYQQRATTNADKLQIFTSTDCGATWTSRKVITAATLASLAGGVSSTAYIPTPTQFTTYTVGINAVITSHNAMFRWEFIADPTSPGNNLYIDDINILNNYAGIQNIEELIDLSVYPNPSTGKVNIELNLSESRTINVSVTDMLGRTVETIAPKSYQTGNTVLSIGSDNSCQAGIYLVNIIIDGQHISKKVIIQ